MGHDRSNNQTLAPERRSLFLKMLQEDISLDTIAVITEFAISEVEGFANGQLQAL
jgi:hypothetical protein